MSKYIVKSVYSNGENALKHWQELVDLLNKGAEIVSSGSDKLAIHFVLKVPNETKE